MIERQEIIRRMDWLATRIDDIRKNEIVSPMQDDALESDRWYLTRTIQILRETEIVHEVALQETMRATNKLYLKIKTKYNVEEPVISDMGYIMYPAIPVTRKLKATWSPWTP